MQKVLKSSILLVLILLMFCTSFTMYGARASEVENALDYTNVLDDLRSAENFNDEDYPVDKTDNSIKLLNVVEWAYNESGASENYAIYLYLYNPSLKAFDAWSESNKAQIAVSYTNKVNGKVTMDSMPSDYEKFNLKFCSASSDGRFIKYSIIDHVSADGKCIQERVEKDLRRYDISGIELVSEGKQNATEYGCGVTTYFSGFAKGCAKDVDAESTLKNEKVNELLTIKLDVEHTNYLTGVSEKGLPYRNNLNSVYFSIPNEYLETYGGLQKIKAEWNEYKTTPMFVTKDVNVYNDFAPYVGKDLSTSETRPTWYAFESNAISAEVQNQNGDKGNYTGYNYNILPATDSWGIPYRHGNSVFKLSWLFHKDVENLSDCYISSTEVRNYLYASTKKNDNTYPITEQEKFLYEKGYDYDLFLNEVDKGRTYGYNVKEFDAGDEFNLLDYDSTHNSWQRFWDMFLKWGTETGGGAENVVPILPLSDDNVTGNETVDVSNLLINAYNYDDFINYYNQAKDDDKTTFLFRFAVTDYYAQKTALVDSSKLSLYVGTDGGYFAQQTMFLDFDVLTLTFNKDGTYMVIPAVMSPFDVVSGLNPPSDTTDNGEVNMLWAVLGFVFIVVFIVLFIVKGIIMFKLYKKDWNVFLKIIVALVLLGIFIAISCVLYEAVDVYISEATEVLKSAFTKGT